MEAGLFGEGVEVTIDFCKTDKDKLEVYCYYKLWDAMVSGYSVSSGGDRPSESISINFTKFEFGSTTMTNLNTPDAKPRTGWDIGQGQAVVAAPAGRPGGRPPSPLPPPGRRRPGSPLSGPPASVPMALSQVGRLVTVTTPLGADAFVCTAARGREELSRPFAFTLDLLTDSTSVAPADLVGQPVGWKVNMPAATPRLFHGHVARLVAGPTIGRGLRAYRADVVPWLWFLTRTADCKIFQAKTVPDILTAVFDAFGFSAYQNKLTATYPTLDYCVQYRETAFAFVSRLMEEYGIYYTFTHAAGEHTLVLADDPSGYAPCDPHASVEYRPDLPAAEAISRWERAYQFGSGKVAHTDYNFETPATALLKTVDTAIDLAPVKKYELFDYPGRYGLPADGQALAKVRIEEQEAGYDTAAGDSRCSSFRPGGTFTLKLHPADDGDYVLTAVEHTAAEPWAAGSGGGGSGEYANTFVAAPAAVPFRPTRTTPRPAVVGVQPAVVVGPSGEEIHTDQYGRVKVQFFWDRLGANDEKSSCWVRVAEMWAGKQWGMVFTPRIGQEVLVEFLDGDPDRPVVTGRVYNAAQMPPYALPDNMTQSGLKTRSTKGGGTDTFNELRFEDKKDAEDIYFHGQKDFHRVVEHDDDTKVGNDQSITVKNNRTLLVEEGYEKITISKGDRERTVSKGNDTLTVTEGNRTVTVSKGDDAYTVSKGNLTLDITKGTRTTTVEGDDKLTVNTGSHLVTVSTADAKLGVTKGDWLVDVAAGLASVSAAKSITLKVGSNSVVIDTKGITLDASKITLVVGGNKVELAAAGIDMKGTQVKIAGVTVEVAGDAQTKVSGAMLEVAGSGMAKISGGVVMIN